MDPLHAFNAAFRKVAKLPFVICLATPFKSVRYFSAWKKPPLLEDQPLKEVSNEETAALQPGRSPETPKLQETRRLNSTPHPHGKNNHQADVLENKPFPKFRTKALPSTFKEEFRNLRNDDFASKQKKPKKSLSPRKESRLEIFSCSLALEDPRGVSQDGISPGAEKFSQYAEERSIPVKRVQKKVLDALCKGGVHQGVCLEASPLRPLAWQEGPLHRAPVGKGSQRIWLVLEGIHDPMNLGALRRHGGFDVFSTDDVQELLKIPEDIPVATCSDFRWTEPTILLLGNEGYGLCPETRMLCHRMLTITPGRDLEFGVESLNVSVA
ncbi:hypothetical protein E2320_018146, partial [Naja naja]